MNLSPLAVQKFFDNNGRPLVGGLLFTYAAGTNNKLATYSNEAGTLNPNPIVLNYRGEANIWLDQELTYKFVLSPEGDTDPPTKPIWSVDDISAAVTFASLTQQIIGQLLYPITEAETLAGISIVNWFYPPLCIDRYGTNTVPLTTSMTAAVQAAIDVAKQGGGVITWTVPPYLIDGPLNNTTTGQPNQYGWIFRGRGGTVDATKIDFVFKHTGFAFDCTGSHRLDFEDMNMGTDPSTFPKGIFLLARNVSAGSAGWHSLKGLRFRGKVSDSFICNYASEGNFYEYLDLQCDDTGPTKCVTITQGNIRGWTSSFTTIATGPQSCLDHQFVGGEFFNNSGNAAADIFELEGTRSLKLSKPWMRNASASSAGRALFYVNTTNASADFVRLRDVEAEISSFNSKYGVYFGDTARTCTGWTIDSCYLESSINAIFAHANVTLDNFQIRQINETTSNGISIGGTLQNSVIDSATTIVAIGTSARNTLVGDSARWTITTRSNDFWIDSGADNKTWTPALGTVTHGGVLTINTTRFLLVGNMAHFEFMMTDTVSITATLGQTITGLPFATAFRSADVQVANEATFESLGLGFIDSGTTIRMPAFSVGAGEPLVVSGSYFVA